MRAYRLIGTARAEMVDVPPAQPEAGEVVLRVLAAGVCRTDVSLLRNGGRGLDAAGDARARDRRRGGRSRGGRATPPAGGRSWPCTSCWGAARCAACAQGEDNVCRDIVPGAIGITTDGGMADQVVVPARNLVALGRSTRRGRAADGRRPDRPARGGARAPSPRAGSTALVVVGIGGLGHLAVQFLRATSESSHPRRRRRSGPPRLRRGHRGRRRRPVERADAADELVAANGGHRIDAVFDFVGSQESLDLGGAA